MQLREQHGIKDPWPEPPGVLKTERKAVQKAYSKEGYKQKLINMKARLKYLDFILRTIKPWEDFKHRNKV